MSIERRRAGMRRRAGGRRGVVLFAVLATLVALGMLAGTIALVAAGDLRMVGRQKRGAEAFVDMDRGVQYVKSMIDAALAAGTLALSGEVVSVYYAAPAGTGFDAVTQLVRVGTSDHYVFRLTGRSPGARAMADVVFRQASTFEMGLFADGQLEVKAYGGIYAYDSTRTPLPTPSDALGGALMAANGTVWTRQDSFLDGSFLLGQSASGTDAGWTETPSGGSLITGEEGLQTDRIDPDPLGAVGGPLAAQFVYYSNPANNNNATADPPVIRAPQNRLTLGSGASCTLTAGDYYLSDVDLRNGSTLIIDDSAGPVNIYLTGAFNAGNGSQILVTSSPSQFALFSNSTRSINLSNSSSVGGLIYAPYASVTINNSGDFYGSCWAKNVQVNNSGSFYMDLALLRRFLDDSIKILSWKEVRV